VGQAAVRLGPSGAALRQKAPPTVTFGHLVRTALVIAPLVLCAAGMWRGGNGAGSAAFGLALAGANLFISATGLDWAAMVSPTAVAAVALGGYVARLAVITIVVLLMKDLSWVDLPAMSISIVIGHLGLLIWEARTIHLAAEPAPSGPAGTGRE